MTSIRIAALAIALASPAVFAGSLTGNVGVVSDYMFRGLDRSDNGAAVQGGVDYGFDNGIYSGLWVTNSALAGGNEADIYAGYGLTLGSFKLDFGAVYYLFSEDTEQGSAPNKDYAEVYASSAVGPVTVHLFYAPEFGLDQGGAISGDPEKNEMLYFSASVNLPFNDTLSLVPQVGLSAGDGVKDAFGDEYLDYSLTAIKKLENDTSVSLALVGTNLESNPANDDNPKFVIGFKKNFKI